MMTKTTNKQAILFVSFFYLIDFGMMNLLFSLQPAHAR
jgi:hypothetical protein